MKPIKNALTSRTYITILLSALLNLAFIILRANPKLKDYQWMLSAEIQTAMTVLALAALGYLKHDDRIKTKKLIAVIAKKEKGDTNGDS